MLAENVSAAEILEDFPDLELEDIQACLLFGACPHPGRVGRCAYRAYLRGLKSL